MKKVLDVPKVKQLEKCYCPIACLKMVFNYYGVKVSQKEIADEISTYNPEYFYFPINKHGCYHFDIIRYSREKGFIAHNYGDSSLEKLMGLIEKDIPPIARIRSSKEGKTAHLCVMKGYDLEKKLVYLNDPGKLEKESIDFQTFKKLWVVKSEEWGDSKNNMISIRPK